MCPWQPLVGLNPPSLFLLALSWNNHIPTWPLPTTDVSHHKHLAQAWTYQRFFPMILNLGPLSSHCLLTEVLRYTIQGLPWENIELSPRKSVILTWNHWVQFSSVAQSCLTLCNPMNHSTPGLLVYHQFPEFTQTHVHRVSDAIQPSHPLSSPFPPTTNPSQHQSFSNESTLHMRWTKYWSFSFSITPSNEHPGLISFRMNWLDLLIVQGALKSLLQHHSSKASILRRSAFFTVQLSHPYMTTGKP